MSTPVTQAAAAAVQPFSVVAIVGPMFAGKTARLIRTVAACREAGRRVLVLKPAKDTRDSHTALHTHNHSETCEALELKALADLPHELEEAYDVIAIDEAQFFDDARDGIQGFADRGKAVIVAALDSDYKREAFLDLSCVEHIVSCRATCSSCGKRNAANFTKRVVNVTGKTVIGGSDIYKPLCRACWVLENAAGPCGPYGPRGPGECKGPGSERDSSPCGGVFLGLRGTAMRSWQVPVSPAVPDTFWWKRVNRDRRQFWHAEAKCDDSKASSPGAAAIVLHQHQPLRAGQLPITEALHSRSEARRRGRQRKHATSHSHDGMVAAPHAPWNPTAARDGPESPGSLGSPGSPESPDFLFTAAAPDLAEGIHPQSGPADLRLAPQALKSLARGWSSFPKGLLLPAILQRAFNAAESRAGRCCSDVVPRAFKTSRDKFGVEWATSKVTGAFAHKHALRYQGVTGAVAVDHAMLGFASLSLTRKILRSAGCIFQRATDLSAVGDRWYECPVPSPTTQDRFIDLNDAAVTRRIGGHVLLVLAFATSDMVESFREALEQTSRAWKLRLRMAANGLGEFQPDTPNGQKRLRKTDLVVVTSKALRSEATQHTLEQTRWQGLIVVDVHARAAASARLLANLANIQASARWWVFGQLPETAAAYRGLGEGLHVTTIPDLFGEGLVAFVRNKAHRHKPQACPCLQEVLTNALGHGLSGGGPGKPSPVPQTWYSPDKAQDLPLLRLPKAQHRAPSPLQTQARTQQRTLHDDFAVIQVYTPEAMREALEWFRGRCCLRPTLLSGKSSNEPLLPLQRMSDMMWGVLPSAFRMLLSDTPEEVLLAWHDPRRMDGEPNTSRISGGSSSGGSSSSSSNFRAVDLDLLSKQRRRAYRDVVSTGTCPICTEPFADQTAGLEWKPVIVPPCHIKHMVCESCMRMWAGAKAQASASEPPNVPCPQCRSRMDMPLPRIYVTPRGNVHTRLRPMKELLRASGSTEMLPTGGAGSRSRSTAPSHRKVMAVQPQEWAALLLQFMQHVLQDDRIQRACLVVGTASRASQVLTACERAGIAAQFTHGRTFVRATSAETLAQDSASEKLFIVTTMHALAATLAKEPAFLADCFDVAVFGDVPWSFSAARALLTAEAPRAYGRWFLVPQPWHKPLTHFLRRLRRMAYHEAAFLEAMWKDVIESTMTLFREPQEGSHAAMYASMNAR
jgi:thymidine kinase